MLNNTRLNKIISESIHRVLLAEGQADKVLRNAIRQNADGYYQPYLDTPVAELPDNLRNNIQQADPNTFESCARQGQPLLQYFRITFLKYFDIGHDKGPAQYLRGIGRIALGELGFFNGRRDESSLSKFKMCVMFLYQNPQLVNVQFDGNFNGMSYYDFIAVVNTARREFNKGQRERLSTMGTVGGDYDIVPINSEEEALKYGKYTSWCITRGGAYNIYAKGGSRFYFCLRKGFESVPRERGEGCPLDDYGLSMISVLVDMDGEPVLITTRWNHDYDGENNENLRTVEQFQEITHINWYATFKPYTREELRAMGITPFDEVQGLLDAGTEPFELFEYIGDFTEGFAEVALNGKWNFIDAQGNILSRQWFVRTDNFKEGFARVELHGKWNFLTQDGNLLTEQWFDFVGIFSEGFAEVALNGKWNFIDAQGNILSRQWFVRTDNFKEGFARVELHGKWNYLTQDGKFLSKQWFGGTRNFSEGFAEVALNGKWNFIDTQGNILSRQWFVRTDNFKEGFARVELHGKWNFLTQDGNLLTEQWFDFVGNFSEGFAALELHGKWNFLTQDGNLLTEQWFDFTNNFKEGFARVELNGKWNFIDTEGNIYNKRPRRTVNEQQLRRIIKRILLENLH